MRCRNAEHRFRTRAAFGQFRISEAARVRRCCVPIAQILFIRRMRLFDEVRFWFFGQFGGTSPNCIWNELSLPWFEKSVSRPSFSCGFLRL